MLFLAHDDQNFTFENNNKNNKKLNALQFEDKQLPEY